MNIGRMFASAIVRRLAYVLIALLLAWLGVGDASAQTTCPNSAGNACTQGSAYAACMSQTVSENSGWTWANKRCTHEVVSSTWAVYSCLVDRTRTSDGAQNNNAGCQAGNQFWYMRSKSCSAQPPTSGGYYRLGSTPNSCVDGCVYSPVSGSTTSQQVINGVTYMSTSQMVPSGDVCGENDGGGTQVTQEECHTQGTLTQCIRPDGKHCAQASSGKRFCWSPSEAGTKQEGNEGATKSPTGTTINPPKNPPPNGGDWTSTGSGGMSNTSGGTTNNYTITSWNSTYGNTGTGGGSTNPDGSENGNGDGEGDGEDDGNGPGPSTGESLGDLYTPTEDTAASLMQAFFNAAGDTALLSQINTFFGNCGYAGTCPQWSYETDFTGNMTFAQLCDGTIGDILSFAGFAVLAVAAFGAFRIAIY